MGGNLSGNKKNYNPNRFSPLDGAIAYIVILVVYFIVGILVNFITKTLMQRGILKDYYSIACISVVFSQLSIFLTALVFYKVRKVTFFGGEGYGFDLNAIKVLMSIMLAAGILLCFTPLHEAFHDDIVSLGFPDIVIPEELLENANGSAVILYVCFLATILPAFVEELLFRGVIMRSLSSYGNVVAVFGSALLFALMHGSPLQFILQFIGGVAIATVVLLTKNHIYGCIMHCCNNAFAYITLLLQEIPTVNSDGINFAVNAAQIIIGIIFLCVSVLYFIKLALDNYKKKLTGKQFTHGEFESVATVKVKFDNEEIKEIAFDNLEEITTNEKAGGKFLVEGKFISLNDTAVHRKSAAVLYGVGIVLAIFSTFATDWLFSLIFIL